MESKILVGVGIMLIFCSIAVFVVSIVGTKNCQPPDTDVLFWGFILMCCGSVVVGAAIRAASK